MTWKLKMVGDHAEVRDGLPVWANDADGTERTFDGPKLFETVGKIRSEKDEAETKARDAEGELRKYGKTPEERKELDGKLDAARKLDAKKLIEADKLDEALAERMKPIRADLEALVAAANAERDKAVGRLTTTEIDRAILGSDFRKRIKLPDEAALALFRPHFEVDAKNDYAVVAYGDPVKKSKLFSKSDGMSPASIDEALEQIVNAKSYKEEILLAPNASGPNSNGGPRALAPANLQTLSPLARLETAFAGKAG